MYLTITIVFGHFPRALVEWVFFSNVQVQNLEDSLFFIYIFFEQSKACMGFIPESQLKSKISHSLIHMVFIGLVTWSGLKGLRKKGLERLKECLRVTLSKNFESLACTLFISTLGLGSTPFVLYINLSFHFVPFLAKFGDLLSLFFSLAFGGFCFLFPFIVAQLHACVFCIALPASLAVVLTQGFYFAFAIFFCCF